LTVGKIEQSKKCLFLEFHKDDTRKTVLEHDFHSDTQSRWQDGANLVCGNMFEYYLG